MDHYPNAEAEIKKSLGGYDALIWNTKFRLTGELLDLAALDAVKMRGLPLGNTPKALDNSVADITVGLMISAARRFKEGDIAGSTVGIVGFGGIGQAVARRLRGFDVGRFLYSGRSDKPEGII
ncbi:Uncharacterized protein OBRU01_26044, partial [Operophtera brumata]